VEVGFADGSKRIERVLDSRGTPARPFTWDQLQEKALALTAPCRPPLDLGVLRELIQGLPKAKDVAVLERLLTGEPAAATASSRKAGRA
jgi:hypothetical protein